MLQRANVGTFYGLALVLNQGLALNTVDRVGERLKAVGGDLLATTRTYPVAALIEPIERRIDLRQQILGVVAECDIALAGEDFCCVIRDMVADAVIILLGLVVDRQRLYIAP